MKMRKFEMKDADFMLGWMHDGSVTQYLQGVFAAKSIEDCRQFIQNSQSDNNNLHMAIVDEDDIYMGTVSLKHIRDSVAEFAIVLRPCAMGKGFSQYAMKEIIRIGFTQFRLDMIYWCVNPLNQRAVHFYDKNGYTRMDIAKIYPRLIKTGYTKEQIQTYDWYGIKIETGKAD